MRDSLKLQEVHTIAELSHEARLAGAGQAFGQLLRHKLKSFVEGIGEIVGEPQVSRRQVTPMGTTRYRMSARAYTYAIPFEDRRR